MATSGQLNTNTTYDSYFWVKWEQKNQYIANNQTVISWSVGVYCGHSFYSNAIKMSAVTINGTKVYNGGTYSNYSVGNHTIASGTLTINHNSDGTKTFSISAFTGWLYSNNNYSSNGGSYALTAIPRQATLLTAPDFSDEDNPTVTYSNPAGNAATKLEVGIYNAAGNQSYIPYKEVKDRTTNSFQFKFTDAERDVLRAACTKNTLTVRFYIKTTIGGKSYISSPLERTLSIVNANPVITASVVDTNATTIALTGDNKKLVKYYSNAKATMSAQAQKGASINENLYIIRNGNNTGYGTTHTFNNVENNRFTFSAEDSRENVGTTAITPTMINYIKPTCSIANTRPDALGNMTVACSGSYFNGNFGAAANTLTVQYRYAILGGEFGDWTDMNVSKNGNSYSASANFVIPDFVQTRSYSFETRAIDKLATVVGSSGAVKSKPVFHWGENDFVFEVPVTFNAGTNGEGNSSMGNEVAGDLKVTGNLRLKGSGNYGNTLLFGDGTYCYISEPEDDKMYIKASRIDLDANGVYVYGNPIPAMDKGVWTPTLNSAVVSSYTTQYGWYSKMGQTVSVGFYIKATCKSGYTSTQVSISGLPFTPMFASAGGGMCSGAYISGGFNFQCFVAETSKSITIRVQSCNHTSQTNLSTSASGCWYPSGGGELTLSGTITFIANT